MEKSVTHQRIAGIFNEWIKRYSENPNDFGNLLNEDGKPFDDYGDQCATYFHTIADELDSKNRLPRPSHPTNNKNDILYALQKKYPSDEWKLELVIGPDDFVPYNKIIRNGIVIGRVSLESCNDLQTIHGVSLDVILDSIVDGIHNSRLS